MSLQQIAGQGPYFPGLQRWGASITVDASVLIDATGEKIAFIGKMWNKDRTTKSITKVGFKFGTVVKAGGSGLTVSLQNVDTTVGPPPQPDGVQDQTVVIANGDAAFMANVWYQTAALSASRSVAFGEDLAVVIEYDANGRLGTDSVVAQLAAAVTNDGPATVSLYTTSWAAQFHLANIILEFTDGTFGTLSGSFPYSDVNGYLYNLNSGADEYALEFSNPFPCNVDGAWLAYFPAASGDAELILYDGTTPMTGGTVTLDANVVVSNTVIKILHVPFSQEIYLNANTTYRLALRPTTTNNVTLRYIAMNNANHFQAYDGGTAYRSVSRVNQGAWNAAITTQRPMMGLQISALDNGGGGNAGPWGMIR